MVHLAGASELEIKKRNLEKKPLFSPCSSVVYTGHLGCYFFPNIWN